MKILSFAQQTLRIFQVLDVEGSVCPVRAPQSDYDWLFSGGCAVEFGEHCGRAALHHFIVIKLITRLDVFTADAHEAGARLDSDDFAVKSVSVPFEVRDRVCFHIGGHSPGEKTLVIPDSKIFQLIAVFRPVVFVGSGQPGIQEEVYIALRQTGVDRCHFELHELNRVSLSLQDVLPQIYGGYVFSPGNPTDLNGLSLTWKRGLCGSSFCSTSVFDSLSSGRLFFRSACNCEEHETQHQGAHQEQRNPAPSFD